MHQANDYRAMGMRLHTDKQKYLHLACHAWEGTVDFWAAMGLRPKGATLAKRSQKYPHGPGNSYWKEKLTTPKSKNIPIPRQKMRELLRGRKDDV